MNFQNDKRAKQRRNVGQTREMEVFRDVHPDPKKGGSWGYDVHHRIEQIHLAYYSYWLSSYLSIFLLIQS